MFTSVELDFPINTPKNFFPRRGQNLSFELEFGTQKKCKLTAG
uniref:Uncharacterized protein n=1 Tax=Arundo donax TaxID=35708 RepID=A0A0A8YPZ9_ARUDO